MNKAVILIFIFSLLIISSSIAQTKTQIFTTMFLPESITYNGSDNPNECWESVTWGIRIKTDKINLFFTLEYKNIEKLKEQIGDNKVLIEVIYFNEPVDKSGAAGNVIKITFKNEVIYKNIWDNSEK